MFAKVIIDQDAKAIDKVFEYIIPDNLAVVPGMRVYVGFGSRTVQGFVIEVSEKCDFDESKLKKIISIIDEQPAIKKEMLEVMKFMVKKFHLKQASILRLFIPAEMREGKVKELFEKIYSLSNKEINIVKNAKQQLAIVDFLKEHGEGSSVYLNGTFGNGAVRD